MFSPTLRVTKSATTHPERGGARPFTDECRRAGSVFDHGRRAFLSLLMAFLNDGEVPAEIRAEEVDGTISAIRSIASLTDAGL